MPNRCGVVNCKGNYNPDHKVRIFKLPKDPNERQTWIDVLPPRKNFTIDPDKFHICENHWPKDVEMIRRQGGFLKPVCPPSIFDVPPSCLPTPKPTPREPKAEDRQLNYFLEKDSITTFDLFKPERELNKLYTNIMISRTSEKFICLFMTDDFSESTSSIVVHNKSTLCTPVTRHSYKSGIRVPMGKILHPNNGLSSYSQFFSAVHSMLLYQNSINDVIKKAVSFLQPAVDEFAENDLDKTKRLKFVIRQLELLVAKNFSINDYCLALECYPRPPYDLLREYLVLPSSRTLQGIVSASGVDQVLCKMYKKTNDQQKNSFLLVDEVKIRPTIAYSSGVLNGLAKNQPDSKASSMLCVLVKCLHGGPSLMISATPVHKLTAAYQFKIVKEAAALVEANGGIVLGSITDNHKVNQQYCKLFDLKCGKSQAIHPLDSERTWFLLYDTVHLLKCIRNNWISEKCQKLSLDGTLVGSFSDVKAVYEAEVNDILKLTPLTYAAVHPSRLQLQNVKYVLKVVNEKVVAALKENKANDTAVFIQQVLDWWNIVNVGQKGMEVRKLDPNRAVQDTNSTNLEEKLQLFESSKSGHGANRIQCLTHDTHKALVQTMEGLIAVKNHLLSSKGFEYVLLREIQSDRIEGEFSVYRQSTGSNAFMTAGDVFSSFKKRLARFAASYLQSIEHSKDVPHTHTCQDIDIDDASSIEQCINDVSLSDTEVSSSAFVAGWLEKKCGNEVVFSEDESLVSDEASHFIQEVSRGSLVIPHQNTFDLVKLGLCFVKHARHRTCCRQRLVKVLTLMDDYYKLELSSRVVSCTLSWSSPRLFYAFLQ